MGLEIQLDPLLFLFLNAKNRRPQPKETVVYIVVAYALYIEQETSTKNK